VLRRALAVGLPALALLAALAGWAYLGGAYFEILRPLDYGKLRIEARFGPGESPADRPVSAALLPRDGSGSAGSGVAVRMPGFAPAALALLPGGGGKAALSSGNLYLKPGNYVLALTIGEKQYSEAFYLPPFRMQKADGREEGVLLSYSYSGHERKPLSLSYRVFDERMGRDITDKATLSIKSAQGYWIDAKEYPKEELVSGKGYALRVSAQGFSPAVLSVAVGPLQTALSFRASLVPIDGKLSISSSIEGLKLTINGLEAAVAGDSTRRLQYLRMEGKKALSLSLQPGRLRLEAQAGIRRGGEDVVVASGEELRVRIEPGSAADRLKFMNDD